VRDHADATQRITGTPELLPRPTKMQLAKETGLSKPVVSKCFKDDSARELKLYWEIALNLARVMAFQGPISTGSDTYRVAAEVLPLGLSQSFFWAIALIISLVVIDPPLSASTCAAASSALVFFGVAFFVGFFAVAVFFVVMFISGVVLVGCHLQAAGATRRDALHMNGAFRLYP
jgi:hypothetical protein